MRKHLHKKWSKIFSSKFEEIRVKKTSRPQKFACSYSYGRYDPHIAQEAGLFMWCHVMMIL